MTEVIESISWLLETFNIVFNMVIRQSHEGNLQKKMMTIS